MNVPQAFDSLAETYDDQFSHSPIARYLRERIHERLDLHFQAGDHVLELGCGTGEDAFYLAQRGVQVTATDSSEAMLAITRAKTQNNPLVQTLLLDINAVGTRHALSLQIQNEMFDGCTANFGPLNILADRRPLAAWLAERMKPGGTLGFGVMAPLCLWEIGWHSLHLDFKTALRRVRGKSSFQTDDGSETIPIYYPGSTHLEAEFAPWFKRIHLEPLGLFLPPSDIYGVIEKRPRLLRLLTMLEDRSRGLSLLSRFADHYWIEFQRLPGE